MPPEKSIILDNIRVYLAKPEQSKARWIGNEDPIRQLTAAWSVFSRTDRPMTPAITGKPGIGKTSLAVYCAQKVFKLPVYIYQSTQNTDPEDILINPVYNKDKKIIYRASSLISAMVQGGVFILEDANRLPEKVWAHLVPLLDGRNYLESQLTGVKITPHRKFKFVAVINDASPAFQLPEYIFSRLGPKISVNAPDKEDILKILKEHVPEATEDYLEYVSDFLKKSPIYQNLTDSINMLRFSVKMIKTHDLSYEDALKEALRSGPKDIYREIEEEYFNPHR